MTYEKLIETISTILENDNIEKSGLILTYELPEIKLDQINREIFRKTNPYSSAFVPTDEFEVMLGGILVKFKKI